MASKKFKKRPTALCGDACCIRCSLFYSSLKTAYRYWAPECFLLRAAHNFQLKQHTGAFFTRAWIMRWINFTIFSENGEILTRRARATDNQVGLTLRLSHVHQINCILAATYLRSTTSKCRLNNVHCCKGIADGIDVLLLILLSLLYQWTLRNKITLEDLFNVSLCMFVMM